MIRLSIRYIQSSINRQHFQDLHGNHRHSSTLLCRSVEVNRPSEENYVLIPTLLYTICSSQGVKTYYMYMYQDQIILKIGHKAAM